VSLSVAAAAAAIEASLGTITHAALFTANPITAGDLNDELANTAGYIRQALPTMTDSNDEEESHCRRAYYARHSSGSFGKLRPSTISNSKQ
jgi:hypothetical protein